MVNRDEVAGRRALIVLIARRQEAEAVTIPVLAHEPKRVHFGIDGLGKALGKSQTEEVGAEIVHRDYATKAVGQVLPAVYPEVLTTLVLMSNWRTFLIDDPVIGGLQTVVVPKGAESPNWAQPRAA